MPAEIKESFLYARNLVMIRLYWQKGMLMIMVERKM